MLTIQANQKFRNVSANSLENLRVYKDSVFYGINGSGKSTICELLSNPERYEFSTTDGDPISEVFAFNRSWRDKTVGDFTSGGSAKGVTTVLMGDDAGNLQRVIKKKEKELSRQKAIVQEKRKTLKRAGDRLTAIKDNVFNGIRKELASECGALSGNAFNRNKIEKLLRQGPSNRLNDEEVLNALGIIKATSPGSLSDLPPAPRLWAPDPGVWDELRSSAVSSDQIQLIVTNWMQEGMDQHVAGDSCKFCAGIVSQARLDELQKALDDSNSKITATIAQASKSCDLAISHLEMFKSSMKTVILKSVQFETLLDDDREKVIEAVEDLLKVYNQISSLLTKRKNDLTFEYSGPALELPFSEFDYAQKRLVDSYSKAREALESHEVHKARAEDQLKDHCCAVDGDGWKDATEEVERSQVDLTQAEDQQGEIEQSLEELFDGLSVTTETAQFIDRHLQLILGDDTLRVTVGREDEGYRITRRDQVAADMSEGEKKLISLLYFCAEFRSKERLDKVKRSVVLFDDLGSELDDSRLIAVDRFITETFSNQRPLAILYFTHSYSHFKLLISRLGKRAAPSGTRDKPEQPSAGFYEIYKELFSESEQTTKVEKWDLKTLKLTSDYALSFYMVLKNMNKVIEGKPISFGTGNYCRKVLEGFTEFKSPTSTEFGSRIDHLCRGENKPISASLSRLVNMLSHSSLDQESGILSRQEMQTGLVQTLLFVHEIDSAHFELMVKGLLNREDARTLIDNILSRKIAQTS
ncbi:hypothetical protein CFAEC_06490 [Corynebacterium faecale]|uniref:AAA family ATPase n=1 Tax=Corynebacterium faecale TaxID=1758466 RepID=UPI0025B41C65|nr:AAA family ATPase [Corynebacterium faecale]WJY92128.1 hypothetical protein CFAEC_06490 [Corynebacterium faecale]